MLYVEAYVRGYKSNKHGAKILSAMFIYRGILITCSCNNQNTDN